jgi:hypothetical protein
MGEEAQEWEYGSALRQAEHRIQRIPIELEEETGKRVDRACHAVLLTRPEFFCAHHEPK